MSKVTEYTFINRDETQRMQGWDQYLAFHCVLKHNLDYAFIKVCTQHTIYAKSFSQAKYQHFYILCIFTNTLRWKVIIALLTKRTHSGIIP